MSLKDLCNTDVVSIGPKATVLEAARLMKARHVGELVVVDEPAGDAKPIGIVTDRDLVTQVLAEDSGASRTLVDSVMVRSPTVARETDGLREAIGTMQQAGIRRLPVVDAKGFLVGIISADDLYELLAAELSDLARISPDQISREPSVGAPAY